MRKLLLGTALLALALPALGLNFSKTAAKVTQPKSFAAADINYFEEMAERFNNAEVPAPADFKKLVKGQLALKSQPLAVRPSRLTTSFDGRDYLVCVDKLGQGDKYKTLDIISTLDAAVAGSGRVTIRKDSSILIAQITSGNEVLGYAMYGSPKAQAEAMANASAAKPSAEQPAPSSNSSVEAPKQASGTTAASPVAEQPSAKTQPAAGAAVASAPATDQSILHITPPPPPAAAQEPAASAPKKHVPFTVRATDLIIASGKKAMAVTNRAKNAVSTFYKAHPMASKIAIGASAAVLAAGAVLAIVHFGLPGIFGALVVKQIGAISKSLPGKVIKGMASPFTKKWQKYMKSVSGEIKKPDAKPGPVPPTEPPQSA